MTRLLASEGSSSRALATLQPVIPEPMTAKSIVCGRNGDWAFETVGCGGSCQNETVGFGRGSCGSAVMQSLRTWAYSQEIVSKRNEFQFQFVRDNLRKTWLLVGEIRKQANFNLFRLSFWKDIKSEIRRNSIITYTLKRGSLDG